ncbi:diguanylate cyclase (GGDEF)-like protein [Sphingomonas sp. SORGH_AS802]|uniref:bifunctional diguanylate cyclase/phosphodiesterase n=1 Tax=Sphingomonas sp. SORGH_AS_0802 TaxID=3041800 RepID=UPI002865EC9F|nr:EAL domain-containing protein [Sphingomonas sp. SORGH_AS_0802]MDR6127799.1 diguanylate cyclase (GGDEF)-like protein [Sphingomonas sp. SORGH_AS_0438]MDR6133289.1 diguanylate cyclase (GGDEF)-like protein [Sphingomonas sp. SORGH_AS_0802]
MSRILSCLLDEHAWYLVLVAMVLCGVASAGMYLLRRRARECGTQRRRVWRIAAATVGGLGFWATHFIAMLGHQSTGPLICSPGLTLLSAGVMVVALWSAFSLRDRMPGHGGTVAIGILSGLGVTAMHFIGMAALRTAGPISYDMAIVAPVILGSTALMVAACSLFTTLAGPRQIVWPSLLTTFGVGVLHFGAMLGTHFAQSTHHAHIPSGHPLLVAGVALVGSLIVLGVVAIAIVDRMLTDLRGLASAALEGLVIVQDDRIIEANDIFVALVGHPVDDLRGTSPDRWLTALDGQALREDRLAPFEAEIAGGDRLCEVAVRMVEYRGRRSEVLAVRDLTESRRARDKIAYLARHDALTGLSNRASLREALVEAERRTAAGEQVALLAIDLDRFKAINDLFGHAAGDDVLCQVADILRQAAAPGDAVVRMGGDEFMILQWDQPQPQGAQALAGRIMDRFAEQMDVARNPLAVRASIGVALMPDDGAVGETLCHHADLALYRAKEAGRGTCCFFDGDMDRAVQARRQLEQDLRHTLVRDQLYLVYQPLVCSNTQRIVGYEALVRWKHPERGEIPPSDFIPLAEDSGFIIQLGEWVIREACRAASHWPDHITLAVNVSAVQFQVDTLPDIVRAALVESGFDPRRLEIEITESVLMRDRDAALAVLHRLKRDGVRIAMDDFGTGYSSLSNLQAFPFDKLKIDRSFVSTLDSDDAARSIIRAIVGLGRGLNLPVVAEGVETEAQRRMVAEEGCAQAQGYLFGRPSPDLAEGMGRAAAPMPSAMSRPAAAIVVPPAIHAAVRRVA